MTTPKKAEPTSITLTNSGKSTNKTLSTSIISPIHSPKTTNKPSGERQVSYPPFYFVDKPRSGSMSYNPPFSNGVRNQNYVNPSFKSSDCFSPTQGESRLRSPLAKVLSDSTTPTASQKPNPTHRKADSVFFIPTSKDSYKSPKNRCTSVDYNNFFESVAVDNKRLSLENQRNKLREADKQKKLDQRVQECIEARNDKEDQRQASRKEAMKQTLPTNISIANAKKEAVKNKTREDLSSFVATNDKPDLKAFLETTTSQKGVLDRVADSASKLYENRKVILFNITIVYDILHSR